MSLFKICEMAHILFLSKLDDDASKAYLKRLSMTIKGHGKQVIGLFDSYTPLSAVESFTVTQQKSVANAKTIEQREQLIKLYSKHASRV